MAYENQSEDVKSLTQRKYNDDAKADRAIIRAQEPISGDWVNIGAVDNGDGTFSLRTTTEISAIDNVSSTLNSTTTPLAADGVFLGTFEDIEDYSSLSILVRSDKDSITDGATIEWSNDGTNVRRISKSTITGSSTQGFYFSTPRQAQYFRVRYTNGSQAQTTFVVEIIKNALPANGSVLPILGPIDTATSGLLTRSIITGQSSAGGTTFVNVKVNPSGTLETNVNQSTHDNLNANANIQVNNTDVSNSNPVPISDAGGSLTIDGTVAVSSVIPGTSATNLGKAIDSAVGATDTGIAILAEKSSDAHQSVVGDGDYETLSLTGWQELRTRDQRAQDIDSCNATTGWTVLGNDTTNLATTTDHVFGTGALTFDKVDGAANTVFAGIQKTITSINIQEKFEDGGFVSSGIKIPSLTNVVAAFIRLGTDSSNYNEWEVPVAELSANTWLAVRIPTNQPTNVAGNGWNTSAVTYVAVGVEFSSQNNTLAGIKVDNLHFVQGRITDTSIDATINSSVNTPNINVHRVGGNPTDVGAGAVSTGTQRVIEASDSPVVTNLTSILNALGGGSFAVNLDTTSTANTIYIGQAEPGTATSAATWQVKKLNTSSGVVTTWADGNDSYDNIWDNRTSLSYS